MTNQQPLHIIILAAGKGVRMRSTLPKVLHQIGGKALLEHVITTSQRLNPEAIHVVYGEGGEQVKAALQRFITMSKCDGSINWVEQKQQLGTGHAVQQVLPHLPDDVQVLILCGDTPLITQDLLTALVASTKSKSDALNLITAKLSDPFGYGRIVRNNLGSMVAIVEDKDANAEQKKINEINSGIICTSSKNLKKYLPKLQLSNAQGEYYLTDIIALAINDGCQVENVLATDIEEISGINTKRQLANAERYYQLRQALRLMDQGVTLLDPSRVDIRGNFTTGQDVTIDINAIIEGQVIIGNNVSVGANCFLKDVTIGSNVTIKANSIIEGAVIEDDCIIGPFARVRPQTHAACGAHIGNFVEVKNSSLGKNSKANHLSYIGDSMVGEKVNIGAGTITCNYDGVNKYQTVIEDGAFIGSNTALVAPVKIGANAVIGAGSTITRDAPAEKLTLARAQQTTIEHWQRKPKESQK